jgi:hypothetical protein
MGRNVADTEVRGNIRWHRKTKSELLGIIYLIRVTYYITVEAHRRHPDSANSTVVIHRIIGEL